MSPGKVSQIFLLLIVCKKTVLSYPEEILESDINQLKVDCGNSTTSDFILTFIGDITAMYPRYADTCMSIPDKEKDKENRGIYHTLKISFKDRRLCGVVRDEKDLWRVDIHVQFDRDLITEIDHDYKVSCNYGNLAKGGMGNGKIERRNEYPVELSDDIKQTSAFVLYLEDQLTNHITHAAIGQTVRLGIKETGQIQDCPLLPNNSNSCEKTSERSSQLDCDILTLEPFNRCNEEVDPKTYIKNCQIFVNQLKSYPKCAEGRKQQYICQLQELYECECQNNEIMIDWLPSQECAHKSSLMYVDRCEVSSKTERQPILVKGCGDENQMPKNWQFYSSSSRSTRTQYFDLTRMVEADTITFTCNLHVCIDPYVCEKDCSGPARERSVPGREISVTTGTIYLTYSSLQQYNPEFSHPNLKPVLGHCDGALFTSENFAFFIAVVVLSFVVLVLSVLVVWLICKMTNKTSDLVNRGEFQQFVVANQMEESREESGNSDPVAVSYKKKVSTFARHAFPKPTALASEMTPGPSSDLPGGDRFDHELSVDVCPPLTGGSSLNARFCFPDYDDPTFVKARHESEVTECGVSDASTQVLLHV